MGHKAQRWTEEDTEKVRKLLFEQGYTYRAAAEEMGTTDNALKSMVRRKGWVKQEERGRERCAEPVFGLRRAFDLGPPIKNTDAEIEAVRNLRRRDAEFSAMVVREAVRMGLIGVNK